MAIAETKRQNTMENKIVPAIIPCPLILLVILRVCKMEGATDSRKSTNMIFWLILLIIKAMLENILSPKIVLTASSGATVNVK